MIGKTVSHSNYKIIDNFGGGSIGVVFHAHDTRLDRDVALKFFSMHLLKNKEAMKAYQQLLEIWKNADEDLPELFDTKARLAKLRN